MRSKFKIVIPARYGSTRLPGKPLLDIAGKPMIAHVCDRALATAAEEVVVATDDDRILSALTQLEIPVVMTDPGHRSGTERIAEVARRLNWDDEDIVVNVQGDEPLIPPEYIDQVADDLRCQRSAGMSTLATPIQQQEEIFNPNAVKVVINDLGYALYFSRAPIPWQRDCFPEHADMNAQSLPWYRHIGIYAYTVAFLNRYCHWPPSPLEQIESLEQLRVLWHDEKIAVSTVDKVPPAGVDTVEDLQRVRSALSVN